MCAVLSSAVKNERTCCSAASHNVAASRLTRCCSLRVAASLPAHQIQSDLYQRLSGTSMAVPHVSGALARIWAKFPNCPSDVVRKSIEVTAKDLGPPGKDPMYGYGLLQAEAAYEWLAKQECAQIQLVMTMTEQGQKQQQLGGGQQQPPQRQKAGGEQKQEQPQGQKTGGEQKQQQGRRLADGSSSARQSSLLAQLARPAAGWRQDITEGQ
jgi:hypothetical protein